MFVAPSLSVGKGVLDAVQQGHESPWIVKPAIHWAEKKEPFTHVLLSYSVMMDEGSKCI